MNLEQRSNLEDPDFYSLSGRFSLNTYKINQMQRGQLPHQIIHFDLQDSVHPCMNQNYLLLPRIPLSDDCQSIRQQNFFQDTNHHDSLPLGESQQIYLNQANLDIICNIDSLQNADNENQSNEESIMIIPNGQEEQLTLRSIITYLVEHSHKSRQILEKQIKQKFGNLKQKSILQDLIEKFKKLKKTKEQLIKYCMRKAFKFVLELPKNKHLLFNQYKQKHSFSKSKNRYLKQISEQKSMNNKFLTQIFTEASFVEDYKAFLQHFQDIAIKDNTKKINSLAHLLINSKTKMKSVQMIKRLPWTHAILQKVSTLSQQLLDFSRPT